MPVGGRQCVEIHSGPAHQLVLVRIHDLQVERSIPLVHWKSEVVVLLPQRVDTALQSARSVLLPGNPRDHVRIALAIGDASQVVCGVHHEVKPPKHILLLRRMLRRMLLRRLVARRWDEIRANLSDRCRHWALVRQEAVLPASRGELLGHRILRSCGVGLVEYHHLTRATVWTKAQLEVLVHRGHVLDADVLQLLTGLFQQHLVGASMPKRSQGLHETEGHHSTLMLLDVGIHRMLLGSPGGRKQEGRDTGIQRHLTDVSTKALGYPSLSRPCDSDCGHESGPRLGMLDLSLLPSGECPIRHLPRSLHRCERAERVLRGVNGARHIEHVCPVTAIEDDGQERT
mmetsp:Transcript_9779/g.25308  ORF Transcript_9779/g.25308 Transcript_9779/m.25308 type:complete len:343 (+) Transcript_9779:1217-2245(+)